MCRIIYLQRSHDTQVENHWAREIAQRVKVLAAKPNDLSLILRTLMVEEETQLLKGFP